MGKPAWDANAYQCHGRSDEPDPSKVQETPQDERAMDEIYEGRLRDLCLEDCPRTNHHPVDASAARPLSPVGVNKLCEVVRMTDGRPAS
ncbi:hypothetical protein CSOJ01_11881 [Colletotrichum sojae]|uniref:Uncharacterized protein n=1 Tax=Colletotrichum sojae TaxID=2175907 RepID=A0A8H6IWA4_9PEZI|nr:hypothetical protein CSOJ01_11881 [Colletotrichum sojae]